MFGVARAAKQRTGTHKTPRGRRNAGQKFEKKGRVALKRSKRFGR